MNICAFATALLLFLVTLSWVAPALADDEASNVAHVVAGPYGRCYAKSVPEHVYDPEGEPRQQGRTSIYRVEAEQDQLLHTYDWYAQRLFVWCGAGDDVVVVRLGPWARGHDPAADHLALAFYRAGELMQIYSTLDIAGEELAEVSSFSTFANVSPSVSHYTVFVSGPEMVTITVGDGPIFHDIFLIEAETVDGRPLTFDMQTGELQ